MTATNPFIQEQTTDSLHLAGRMSRYLLDLLRADEKLVETPDGEASGMISFGANPHFFYVSRTEVATVGYRVIVKFSGGLVIIEEGNSVPDLLDQLVAESQLRVCGGPQRYNYQGVVLGYLPESERFQYCLTNDGDGDDFIDTTIEVKRLGHSVGVWSGA